MNKTKLNIKLTDTEVLDKKLKYFIGNQIIMTSRKHLCETFKEYITKYIISTYLPKLNDEKIKYISCETNLFEIDYIICDIIYKSLSSQISDLQFFGFNNCKNKDCIYYQLSFNEEYLNLKINEFNKIIYDLLHEMVLTLILQFQKIAAKKDIRKVTTSDILSAGGVI